MVLDWMKVLKMMAVFELLEDKEEVIAFKTKP